MSADNWRNCPICEPTLDANDDHPRSFREDFEIYSGEKSCKQLLINYLGECQKCGVSFSYNQKIEMDLKNGDKNNLNPKKR
jgi:hypothetical protein